jgi:hypothetical protein
VSNYSKLIAAGVGIVVMLVNQIWGIDLTGFSQPITEGINAVIGAATLFAVHQATNTPKAS